MQIDWGLFFLVIFMAFLVGVSVGVFLGAWIRRNLGWMLVNTTGTAPSDEADDVDDDEPEAEAEATPLTAAGSDELWARITKLVDEEACWRTPGMNMQMLTRAVGSNRAYVGRCFREHAGMTCNEYIRRRRIAFVEAELQRDPSLPLRDLFQRAGYASYSTGLRQWREGQAAPRS